MGTRYVMPEGLGEYLVVRSHQETEYLVVRSHQETDGEYVEMEWTLPDGPASPVPVRKGSTGS